MQPSLNIVNKWTLFPVIAGSDLFILFSISFNAFYINLLKVSVYAQDVSISKGYFK